MIQVTLTFTSIAAAVAALSALPADVTANQVQVTEAPGKPATPNQDKPKAKPEQTSTTAATTQPPASDAQTASSEKPAGSPAKDETPAADIDYDKHVKPLVIKVGAVGKRDALVALLAKFGVAKGPEVPADKLPAFKSELEALVA